MVDRTRRALLAGAAAFAAAPGWAAAGAPRWLGAAKEPSGGYALRGVTADCGAAFRIPLPDRGHAAAAHPTRPLAVAFARRPGRFALVIDCAEGREIARLTPPAGRVFCGHGAFSSDGATLYTTENDYDAGQGRIGVWTADGWRRLGEAHSGGVGPHEAMLAPDGRALIVANGGILTHPDSGRAKLNIPTMRPNLSRWRLSDGAVEAQVESAPDMRLNSLRHIAARADGVVAVAAQWEGDPAVAPPLLALWRPGAGALEWLAAPEPEQRATRGYAGSAAMAPDGRTALCTAPRGGLALAFDVDAGRFLSAAAVPDVCGAAPAPDGFLLSDGFGGLRRARVEGGALMLAFAGRETCAWDNHLVALT